MCTSGTIQNDTKLNHTNEKRKNWLSNLFISKHLNFKRFNHASRLHTLHAWHWTSVNRIRFKFDLMKNTNIQKYTKYYGFVVVKSKIVWMIIIENVKYSKRNKKNLICMKYELIFEFIKWRLISIEILGEKKKFRQKFTTIKIVPMIKWPTNYCCKPSQNCWMHLNLYW